MVKAFLPSCLHLLDLRSKLSLEAFPGFPGLENLTTHSQDPMGLALSHWPQQLLLVVYGIIWLIPVSPTMPSTFLEGRAMSVFLISVPSAASRCSINVCSMN